MTQPTHDKPSDKGLTEPERGRRRLFAGLAAGGVAGALLAGTMAAWSHNHAGSGGWHAGGRWCKVATSLEAQRSRIDFATDWMLDQVNATGDQRAQVKTIVQGAYADLTPLREQHRQNRDAFLAAMQQPSIDRPALDELRQAELKLAEAASNGLVAALADAAEVLTPAQRAKLIKLAEAFRQ